MTKNQVSQNEPIILTVKYPSSSISTGQGPRFRLQNIFFRFKFVKIMCIFSYFMKLHPSKYVKNRDFLIFSYFENYSLICLTICKIIKEKIIQILIEYRLMNKTVCQSCSLSSMLDKDFHFYNVSSSIDTRFSWLLSLIHMALCSLIQLYFCH